MWGEMICDEVGCKHATHLFGPVGQLYRLVYFNEVWPAKVAWNYKRVCFLSR